MATWPNNTTINIEHGYPPMRPENNASYDTYSLLDNISMISEEDYTA